MTPDEIDLAISELETRLERLRALYEQYFMGIERIEPQVVRKDVDRRFWLLRKEKIRNTAKRFKLQTLVQRYNTLQQYWGRICREIEQGTYKRHKLRAERAFGPLDAARAAAAADAAESGTPAPDTRAEAAERAQRALEQDLRLLADNPNADLDAALDALGGGSPRSDTENASEPLASPRKGGLLAQLGTSGARPTTSPSPRTGTLSSPSPQGAGSLPPRVPGSPKVELPKPAGTRDPASRPPAPVPRPSPSVRPAPPSGAAAASAGAASRIGAVAPRVGSAAPTSASGGSSPSPLSPRMGSVGAGATSPSNAGAPRVGSPGAPPTPPPRPHPSRPAQPAPPAQSAAAGPPPTRPRSVPPRPAPGAQARARSVPPPPKPAPPSSGLDEARLRELHQRYQAAREQTKLPGAVSLEKLAQNLRETEAKLRAQHQGRRVDFDVVIKDGKPVIRPKVT